MRYAFSSITFPTAAFLAAILGASTALAVPAPSTAQLRGSIASHLESGKPLKAFYAEVASTYGGDAVAPLLKIAENGKEQDTVRWTSLFALARIAGKESARILKKFMTHPNWMLRDAAIRNAAALKLSELSSSIEARLRDSALIVRTSAVDAIAHLSLKNSAPKLADALTD
ncbi:MAG: HEAT repeat domain-containing protein, partial [Deltaproteobacteria bacterium]|nr:HEAT repeat domain-containing protein [Deltaproteobacteria bacterium]